MQFFETLKQYDIILASQSPRRKELLQHADIPFRVVYKSIQEHFPVNLPPHEVVLRLCQEKARAFERELQDPSVIVITADTIVVNEGKIMNKALDGQEAFEMLESLSGRWHEVLTGVCIRHRELVRIFYESTRVLFRKLTHEEIWYYINQYRPFDKAGAYGIQEWIGYTCISRVEGSYPNVVGLPVERLFAELKKIVQH